MCAHSDATDGMPSMCVAPTPETEYEHALRAWVNRDDAVCIDVCRHLLSTLATTAPTKTHGVSCDNQRSSNETRTGQHALCPCVPVTLLLLQAVYAGHGIHTITSNELVVILSNVYECKKDEKDEEKESEEKAVWMAMPLTVLACTLQLQGERLTVAEKLDMVACWQRRHEASLNNVACHVSRVNEALSRPMTDQPWLVAKEKQKEEGKQREEGESARLLQQSSWWSGFLLGMLQRTQEGLPRIITRTTATKLRMSVVYVINLLRQTCTQTVRHAHESASVGPLMTRLRALLPTWHSFSVMVLLFAFLLARKQRSLQRMRKDR
jgi:hypothetical protein